MQQQIADAAQPEALEEFGARGADADQLRDRIIGRERARPIGRGGPAGMRRGSFGRGGDGLEQAQRALNEGLAAV